MSTLRDLIAQWRRSHEDREDASRRSIDEPTAQYNHGYAVASLNHAMDLERALFASDTQPLRDDARDFDAWDKSGLFVIYDNATIRENPRSADEGERAHQVALEAVALAAWNAARRVAQPTRDVQRAYDVARDVWGATNIIEAVVDALHALYDAAPRERTLMTADEASAYTRAITADEEPGPVQENDHE